MQDAAVRVRLVGLFRRKAPLRAEPVGDGRRYPTRRSDEAREAELRVVQDLEVATVAEFGHRSGCQRRLHQGAGHQVLDRGAGRMLAPRAVRVDRRDAARDAQRMAQGVGGESLEHADGGSGSEGRAAVAVHLRRRDLPVLHVAQIVHSLAEAVGHLMRHGHRIDHVPARGATALRHGECAGDHVGADVPRRQDRIEVERVDEFAIGEGGTENGSSVMAADDCGGAIAAADGPTVVDSDATLGVLDPAQGAANRIEHEALAFVDHRRRELLEIAVVSERGKLFNNRGSHRGLLLGGVEGSIPVGHFLVASTARLRRSGSTAIFTPARSSCSFR